SGQSVITLAQPISGITASSATLINLVVFFTASFVEFIGHLPMPLSCISTTLSVGYSRQPQSRHYGSNLPAAVNVGGGNSRHPQDHRPVIQDKPDHDRTSSITSLTRLTRRRPPTIEMIAT